jgi:chromosome segregation ATPase
LLGNSRRDAGIHLKQLENAFASLPPAFQDRIHSSSVSVDLSTTSYPTNDNLSALAQEAAARQAHAQHLQRLRKQGEAMGARDEQRKLEAQLKELEAIAEQRSAGLKRARQSADQCRSKTEELQQTLAQRRADAQAAQATCEEIARNVQSQIAALPDVWRPQAEALNRRMLRDIEAERDKFRGYGTLFSDLSQARQSLNSLEQRICNLQAQIADLPLPARQATVEIEREIKAAWGQRATSDTRRREASEHLVRLKEQQRRLQELEQQHLKFERAFNLYKILAQMLGPSGPTGATT